MRHHFVPQFLLAAWAEGSPDNKVQEFRLDLPSLPAFRRSTKSTAYVVDLYALTQDHVAGMSQQAVETLVLKAVDNAAARVRRKLVAGTPLTPEEYLQWAFFLNSLRLRQPSAIADLKTRAGENLRNELLVRPEEYQQVARPGGPNTLADAAEKLFPGLVENFGLSLFGKLVAHEGLVTKVLNLKWGVRDLSNGKHDLLLGDHPCISTGVIDAAELVIAVPISPRKAFMAIKGQRLENIFQAMPSDTFAMRTNESSLAQARARIYARDRAPERFIRNRLALLTNRPPLSGK